MTDIFYNRVGECPKSKDGGLTGFHDDGTACNKWPMGGAHFWILIIFPMLSFLGSCYMLLQYWCAPFLARTPTRALFHRAPPCSRRAMRVAVGILRERPRAQDIILLSYYTLALLLYGGGMESLII